MHVERAHRFQIHSLQTNLSWPFCPEDSFDILVRATPKKISRFRCSSISRNCAWPFYTQDIRYLLSYWSESRHIV